MIINYKIIAEFKNKTQFLKAFNTLYKHYKIYMKFNPYNYELSFDGFLNKYTANNLIKILQKLEHISLILSIQKIETYNEVLTAK